MKIFKSKKFLVAIVAIVAAAAIAVSSALLTIAYLTSSAAVSNVFTIGNVYITMTETKVDADGKKFESGEQVDTNTYHLIPGKTYDKDPTITVNAGSVDSYLFVLVRNDIEGIADPAKKSIAEQMAANGWAKYTKASTGWVYVYVGTNNVPTGDATALSSTLNVNTVNFPNIKSDTVTKYTLFKTFSIAPDAKVEAYGAAKITLTAVAIQKEGFANVDTAWAAVIQTYPYIHTGSN